LKAEKKKILTNKNENEEKTERLEAKAVDDEGTKR
jgi:hypothetical protein